jgi:hypothetical protein
MRTPHSDEQPASAWEERGGHELSDFSSRADHRLDPAADRDAVLEGQE